MEDDLPGMLAVAKGVAEQKWPHTTDAQVWVAEWMQHIREYPTIPTDEGAMLAWFANAIMAGYDTAQARAPTAAMNPTEALYGFAAWLTCRPGTLEVGGTHDAAPMAELVKEWSEANGLPEVSVAYPANIVHPK